MKTNVGMTNEYVYADRHRYDFAADVNCLNNAFIKCDIDNAKN